MPLNKIFIDDFLTYSDPIFKIPSKEFLKSTNRLAEFLIEKGAEYNKSEIPFWDLFETGEKYYEDHQIVDLIYRNVLGDHQLYLFTDEGLMENIIFEVGTKSIFQNFTVEYETNYEMMFFQPADYISFFPGEKKINIIHHDGLLLSFDLAD